MNITRASTKAERDAAQELFERTFPGLPSDAVPSDLENNYTGALVMVAADDQGAVIGAALACRPLFVAQWMHIFRSLPVKMRAEYEKGLGLSMQPFEQAPDLVYDLDLIAVSDEQRGSGIARGMLDALTAELIEREVHALVGHTTAEMGGTDVRAFYEKCGFTVVAKSADLPKFGGRSYSTHLRTLPTTQRPVLSFYKVIGPLPDDLPSAPVLPPKVKKQMRAQARRKR